MLRRVFCKLLLVAVVVFSFLAFTSAVMAQGRSADAFERVKEVQELHTERLMALKGVEGTAIGYNQNDQLAIKVFTAGPGVRGIPQELEGVPVQVMVTGKIYALADPTARFDRPVPIGVSTGHPDITAGTIACRVTDGTKVYALSNNHVYANENLASFGDPVIQPGTYDGGSSPDDDIGTLFSYVPIDFHPRANNKVDAAIASTTVNLLGNATPDDGYGTPSSTTVSPTLGLDVKKYGRTTRLTHGEITGVNATVKVSYDSGLARFVGQIIIESTELSSFSEGGDSGSLIVTDNSESNPVGLLFAGNSSVTIANPINAVLDALDVTIDDGSGGTVIETTDIAVSNVSAPASVVQGKVVSVEVTVQNIGNQNVSSLNVILKDTTDSSTIGIQTVSNLVAGASATLTYSWNTDSASIGDHVLMGSHDLPDDDGTNDSISTVVNVTGPTGGGTMHVSAIYMWYSTAGRNYFIYTEVTILGDIDSPVSYATVDLKTTLPDGSTGSGSGTTGSDGTVTFKIKSKQTGTYTSRVTNVIHSALVYDSSQNVEESDDIVVP